MGKNATILADLITLSTSIPIKLDETNLARALNITFSVIALLGTWILLATLIWKFTRNRLNAKNSYSMGDIDDPNDVPDMGVAIKSSVLNEIGLARKGANTLTRVEGAEADLPDPTIELPEHIKWIAPIINTLLKPRRLLVRITIFLDEKSVATLHAQISDQNGRILEARRFSQHRDDDDHQKTCGELPVFAGSWLAFMLSKHAYHTFREYGRQSVEVYGTRSWESYAYLRMSMTCANTDEERRNWLNSALWEDHRNVKALIELARLDLNKSHTAKSRDHGMRHLELAVDLLNNRLTSSGREREYKGLHHCLDARWYQASYSLLAYYGNRFCDFRYLSQKVEEKNAKETLEESAERDLKRALDLGCLLVRSVGATQSFLSNRSRRWLARDKRRQEMKELLDRDALDLSTLLAASLARREQSPWSARVGPVEVRKSAMEDYNRSPSFETIWALLESVAWNRDGKRMYGFNAVNADFFLGIQKNILLLSLFDVETIKPLKLSSNQVDTDEKLRKGDVLNAKEGEKGTPFLEKEKTDEWILILPHRVRYQRACILWELGRENESVMELAQIFDHVTEKSTTRVGGESARELLEWSRHDPALQPLMNRLETHNTLPHNYEKLRRLLYPEY
ncbi:hypothetical protein ACSNO4_03730 [Kocuria flava]|uniref:hypothetical protein n=1 Tax=Kocuria flava TaxID=446860 RepID=UPI003F1C1509